MGTLKIVHMDPASDNSANSSKSPKPIPRRRKSLLEENPSSIMDATDTLKANVYMTRKGIEENETELTHVQEHYGSMLNASTSASAVESSVLWKGKMAFKHGVPTTPSAPLQAASEGPTEPEEPPLAFCSVSLESPDESPVHASPHVSPVAPEALISPPVKIASPAPAKTTPAKDSSPKVRGSAPEAPIPSPVKIPLPTPPLKSRGSAETDDGQTTFSLPACQF